jgi:hypothetical protein
MLKVHNVVLIFSIVIVSNFHYYQDFLFSNLIFTQRYKRKLVMVTQLFQQKVG